MLVSINPLDADCTSPKWFETARDFYAKMILYGQVPYDEYFEKIRKSFCLQDFDPESFPSHVQRFHLYGESGRTKEMFPEVWAVGRDMNSHIFYMVQERSRLTVSGVTDIERFDEEEVVVCYKGTSAPSSNLGNNGDLYFQK